MHVTVLLDTNIELYSGAVVHGSVDMLIRVSSESRSNSELPGNETFRVSAHLLLGII